MSENEYDDERDEQRRDYGYWRDDFPPADYGADENRAAHLEALAEQAGMMGDDEDEPDTPEKITLTAREEMDMRVWQNSEAGQLELIASRAYDRENTEVIEMGDYSEMPVEELVRYFIGAEGIRGRIALSPEYADYVKWLDGIPPYLATLPASDLIGGMYELVHIIEGLEFKLMRVTV